MNEPALKYDPTPIFDTLMTTHIDNDKLKDMDDREDEKREDEQMLETGFSHWGPLNLNFGENNSPEISQQIQALSELQKERNCVLKIKFSFGNS